MRQRNLERTVSWNTAIGILFKVLTLVLSFFSRSVFILLLQEEHLGINGLYSNILSVLSMADLGINAVMIFALYEPLVNHDEARIAALTKLFRKLYHIIAAVILLLGLLIIPLLPYVVSKNTLAYEDLIKYYLLFLSNTVCSYLGVYKSVLLIADQKGYYVNVALFVSNIVRIVLQIAILYILHSYTAYLVMAILGTVSNNIVLTLIANRHYPYLRQKHVPCDVSDIKPVLIERTKSVFFYRMGGTLIDSTDNVLISVLVGTVAVGHYSNYSMITINLFSMLGVLSQACMTGIGNFNITAKSTQKKNAFYAIVLLYFFVGTLILSGMLCAMNDFMRIWLQQERYILSQGFVLVLAIRLFFDIVLSPNWVFREALGMFNEAKNIRLWGAGFNLVLSLIMGKLWGLEGIIGATTISKLLTTFWYEPRIICSKALGESTKQYWMIWLKLLIAAMISVTSAYFAVCWLTEGIGQPVIKLLVKACVCVIVTVGVFAVICIKESQFHPLVQKVSKLFRIVR